MTEQTPATALDTPCATCPYRAYVPAGVWHPEEYAKLPQYDEDTMYQPPAVFMCHQRDGHVCAGWLGVGDPSHLLAVRVGVMNGTVDPSCMVYEPTVPLHASHTAAAVHGMSGVDDPGPDAEVAMAKLRRQKRFRG